jgi:hypothetical protein
MSHLREVIETVRKAVPVASLFLSYMEPLFYVSRGKTGGTDSGKRDYRHRLRTGCIYKRSGAHGCFCDTQMQVITVYRRQDMQEPTFQQIETNGIRLRTVVEGKGPLVILLPCLFVFTFLVSFGFTNIEL